MNREMVVHYLIEGNDNWIDLYHHSVSFKTMVDTLVMFLEPMMEGIAAKSEREDAELRQRFEEAMKMPPLITHDHAMRILHDVSEPEAP